MTIFGCVWILLLLFCFPKKENMIALTIISSTIQCSNVFVFGTIGIGPQIITSLVFIIRILIIKAKLRVKFSTDDWGIIRCLLIVFGVSVASSIYNNNISDSAVRLVQLFVYIMCAFCMGYIANIMTHDKVYKMVRKLTIWMIVFGFVQLIFSSGVFPKLWLFDELFFNEKGQYVYYHSNGGYRRILGSYMEPSYYAGFVVGAFYYFLPIKNKRKENWLIMFFLGIQMILSFASSAYGAFVIVGFLFFLFTREKAFKWKSFFVAIVGFALIYIFFYRVLDQVVFSKISMENDSYRVRYWSDMMALDAFKKSPIIGNGYKTVRGSSIIYTILGELGIIGLVAYIIMNGNIIVKNYICKTKKCVNDYVLAVSLAMMASVAIQILAVPDIDICTYWMWLDIMMLHLMITVKSRGKAYEGVIQSNKKQI